MIFDSIQNKENYREYETLYQILCYLEGLKQGELPLPDTVICENRAFCESCFSDIKTGRSLYL